MLYILLISIAFSVGVIKSEPVKEFCKKAFKRLCEFRSKARDEENAELVRKIKELASSLEPTQLQCARDKEKDDLLFEIKNLKEVLELKECWANKEIRERDSRINELLGILGKNAPMPNIGEPERVVSYEADVNEGN